jgi:copper resistance protein B
MNATIRSKSGWTMAWAAITCIVAASAQAHDMGDEMGHDTFSAAMFDRLEARNYHGAYSTYWEGQAWAGSDMTKAWFKTEGDAAHGRVQTADAQLLYSRAMASYWDGQIGVRHDFQAGGMPARDWLAVALKGLAPYNFDVDASAFLGSQGAAARFKASYSLLLTQRLALLPEVEANIYSKADPLRALGAGLSNIDFSLLMKYEIRREFAPYLGVVRSNKYGATGGYARAYGLPASQASYVAGVRLWW